MGHTESTEAAVHMGHPRYTKEEIAARGKAIYEQSIRDKVEAEHKGEYLVIDIETGEYEMDKDGQAASQRAHAKYPGAAFYGMRVGYKAWGRLGASGVGKE